MYKNRCLNPQLEDHQNGVFPHVETTAAEKEATIPETFPNTAVSDRTGKYICPGLIDSHIHVIAVPGGQGLTDTFTMDHDRTTFRQPRVCQQVLRRGFTTIRD